MTNSVIQKKAADLTAMLSTEDLIAQAKSVLDAGVLDWLLDELQKRLTDEEFTAVCEQIDAEMV